jgi:uncharacterized protein
MPSMRSDLEDILRTVSRPAIAVSGGVDSTTLAALAAMTLPDVVIMHALSPAVPAEATARVERMAEMRQWNLQLIRAGEFDDPNYLANPVNRCFYCKTNLYGTIRAQTSRPMLSGANLDDLAEYRPGLEAARLHAVRHPYIEAGFTKSDVRRLARDLGLHEICDLPSSPCLSSRVETGIRIEPKTLAFVHSVESFLRTELEPHTVRCRIRAAAVVVELDPLTLAQLSPKAKQAIAQSIVDIPGAPSPSLPIDFQPYRNGSAFVGAH